MKTNPEDSAFPSDEEAKITDMGLTKREYFAAKAMQGLIASGKYDPMLYWIEASKQSVVMADELIKELNKK